MGTRDDALDALSVLAAAGALNTGTDAPQEFRPSASPEFTPNESRGESEKPGDAPLVCTCKNSRCLKLYCVCLAANRLCGKDCACRNCHNNGQFPEHRNAAIAAVLERNPAAFEPKIDKGAKHYKGCSCRKSGCLKRYCECFNAGVLCSDLCKCITCKNFEGSADLACGIAPGVGGVMPKHSHGDHNHVHHTQHQPHSHLSAAHHCVNHCGTDATGNSAPHAHSHGGHSGRNARAGLHPGRNGALAYSRGSDPLLSRTRPAAGLTAPTALYSHGDPAALSGKAVLASNEASRNGSRDVPHADDNISGAMVEGCADVKTGHLHGSSAKLSRAGGAGSCNHSRNTMLLQYGKRAPSHRELAVQPPAKRVLFQRGPAFKSKFGEIGSPGGLHYQTNAVEEDRPENMRDAASKALDPSIVSAAEKDTATFLAMFSQRAAGLPAVKTPPIKSPLRKSRAMRGPPPTSEKSNANSGPAHSGEKGDAPPSTKPGVLADDLYCEEQDLGDDDDVDQLTKLGRAAGLDSEAIAALGVLSAGEGEHDGEDEGEHGSSRELGNDDNDSGEGDIADEGDEGVEGGDDAKLTSKYSAPRPPWYASAERHALEHCAAVLRRIANTPPSPAVSAAQRRRKIMSGASSRYYGRSYAPPASSASAGRGTGVASAASPPAPRS